MVSKKKWNFRLRVRTHPPSPLNKWYYYFPTIFRNTWKWLCELIYNGSQQKCGSLCRDDLLASPTPEKRHWDLPRQEIPEEVDIGPSPKLFSTCFNNETLQQFLHISEVPITHLGKDRLFQATVLESPAYPHSVTLSYTTWEYTRSVCFNSRHAGSSSTSRRFLLTTQAKIGRSKLRF